MWWMSNSREQPIKRKHRAQLLQKWRETEDAVSRAENALLKYYRQTAAPRKGVILTILAAA